MQLLILLLVSRVTLCLSGSDVAPKENLKEHTDARLENAFNITRLGCCEAAFFAKDCDKQ